MTKNVEKSTTAKARPIGPPDIHFLRAAEGWLELGDHLEANEELKRTVDEALKGGGAQGGELLSGAEEVAGTKVLAKSVKVPTMKELQGLGDVVRDGLGSGVGALRRTPLG